MTRGELWRTDFGEPFGSEPGYGRPALVIQNDLFNSSRIKTTVVIPLTTNLELANMPGNIFLKTTDTKLSKDSVLLIPQIGVIDKMRLVEKISNLNKSIMEDVDANMMFILGIKSL